MKRLLAIVPLMFALLGCVQSLHPLYTDNQLFYDPNLTGKWTDADQQNTIVVTGDSANKLYNVVLTDEKGKTGRFIVHLAKVQDQMIADIAPADLQEDEIKENSEYAALLVPAHSFMIVEYSPPDLKLRQMNEDWLNRYVKAHPNEIQVEPDRPLMTGSTEQVQAFVLKNLHTPDAYSDAQDVIRVPSTQP